MVGSRSGIRRCASPVGPGVPQNDRSSACRPFALPACLGSLALLSLLWAGPAQAATFTVDRADDLPDSNVGNGTCSVGGAAPRCTLRAAIEEANFTAAADTIDFNIAPGGLQTISILAANGPLPTLTRPVTINGTTQPGYAGLPIIEVNGRVGWGVREA